MEMVSRFNKMKKIIIFENNVHFDGVGDYYHLKDIVQRLVKNPRFANYSFIPIISTSNLELKKTIKNDFTAMGITQFFIKDSFDPNDSDFVNDVRPYYEKAEQVIEVSTLFDDKYKQYLKPGALVKIIYEHERTGSLKWEIRSEIPTLTGSLGLGANNLGIKLSALKEKASPIDFFSTLQAHDNHLATKLLNTTNVSNFTQFLNENTFVNAYFNRFESGFSVFLALLSAMQNNKNIAMHLSSGEPWRISNYFNGRKGGITLELFKKILAEAAPEASVKQIELYEQSDIATTYLINETATKIIRIYTGYLSKPSYEKIFDAANLVGVSGDTSLEKSISHKAFPFYHSTNANMKVPTWAAIKEIVETVDFGFSERVKSDLITYFSYQGNQSRMNFWKELLQINLDGVIEAWPQIADYPKFPSLK